MQADVVVLRPSDFKWRDAGLINDLLSLSSRDAFPRQLGYRLRAGAKNGHVHLPLLKINAIPSIIYGR